MVLRLPPLRTSVIVQAPWRDTKPFPRCRCIDDTDERRTDVVFASLSIRISKLFFNIRPPTEVRLIPTGFGPSGSSRGYRWTSTPPWSVPARTSYRLIDAEIAVCVRSVGRSAGRGQLGSSRHTDQPIPSGTNRTGPRRSVRMARHIHGDAGV
jgi:hypothetical protein